MKSSGNVTPVGQGMHRHIQHIIRIAGKKKSPGSTRDIRWIPNRRGLRNNEKARQQEGAMASDGIDAEGTLAGCGQHQLLPILEHADSASNPRDSADDDRLQSRKLRVVNETRERIDSDASVLADQNSSSTLPPGWSKGDFLEDKDRKARWRDSLDSKDIRNAQIPSSFHDRSVDILIKLRLLPVMKALQEPNDRGGLKEALRRGETVLDFAVKEDASLALQGRCCYYIGVAMHLLDEDEAAQYFISALDAKGVYEEGRWAQQWTNHYDSLGELSPNRIAQTERSVSWASSIGYLKDRNLDDIKYSGSSSSPRHGGEQKTRTDAMRKPPLADEIQPTTPVSTRFSLDIHDDPFTNGTFGSDTPGDTPGGNAGSSIVGGESIPSFSSWGSSPSQMVNPSPPALDTDGLQSPAHISPTQENINGQNSSADLDSPQSSPHHLGSKSVTFDTTALGATAETPENSRDSRPQSSRFRVNPPSALEKLRELSISPSEHPAEEGPPSRAGVALEMERETPRTPWSMTE